MLNDFDIKYLNVLSKKCRADIVRMICGAGSGHIGGALSSADIYITIKYIMNENDNLIISHGHTSAAIYSVLGNMKYFDIEDAVKKFRRESPYEGHPSIEVNGIEWCSGALGQGLSAGCGYALAKNLKGESGTVFVVMGDGEQEKGQLQEAREFAVKHNLKNLIAVIDLNGLQASGVTEEISAQRIKAKYEMSGWCVREACGHSFEPLYGALQICDKPLCVLAKTVMGRGIAEIEGNYKYHGSKISDDIKDNALRKFALSAKEKEILDSVSLRTKEKAFEYPKIKTENAIKYTPGEKVDIRSAMGAALASAAKENKDVPMAVFDCDLEASLKLSEYKKERGAGFTECGIAEHNAVTAAAAVSKCGVIGVSADFSVFNISETYSQLRTADINKCPLKLFSTHAGLDVGEDGKTHQCTDYLGLLKNLYGMKIIVPADANQADAAVRYALAESCGAAVIAGRSKIPVLTDASGKPLGFEYGKADILRKGTEGVIISYGNMVWHAVSISDALSKDGISIGVLNMSSPAQTDKRAVAEAAKTGLIITYEDHNVNTGIGGSIAEIICESAEKCRLLKKGAEKYGASSSPDALYASQGLDENSIKNEIINILKERYKC